MAKRLEIELEEYGLNYTPVTFREFLEEQQKITSSNWTIDELVQHPDSAIAYCNQIRAVLGNSSLPDDFILRTLMNSRKSH